VAGSRCGFTYCLDSPFFDLRKKTRVRVLGQPGRPVKHGVLPHWRRPPEHAAPAARAPPRARHVDRFQGRAGPPQYSALGSGRPAPGRRAAAAQRPKPQGRVVRLRGTEIRHRINLCFHNPYSKPELRSDQRSSEWTAISTRQTSATVGSLCFAKPDTFAKQLRTSEIQCLTSREKPMRNRILSR
jgi:hypothetical protein